MNAKGFVFRILYSVNPVVLESLLIQSEIFPANISSIHRLDVPPNPSYPPLSLQLTKGDIGGTRSQAGRGGDQ